MSEITDATASNGAPSHAPDSPEAPPSKRQRVEEPVEAVPSEFSLAHRIAQAENGAPSAERLVGISSYVNPELPAFEHAIIKHRFTDFLVWEIARGGQVVKLKNISRPESSAAAITPSDENAAPGDTDETKQEEAAVPELKDFLSEEKLKELQAFFEKGRSPETESDTVLTDVRVAKYSALHVS